MLSFLGCQYRISLSSLAAIAPGMEYSRYSLRDKVSVQLSVDPQVWPLASFEGSPMRRGDMLEAELQAEDFPLMAFDEFLKRSSEEASVLVFLSRWDSVITESKDAFCPESMECEFIGFDVCDEIYRSAIANIGLGDKWDEVRMKYMMHTNGFGLFVDAHVARSYADEFSVIVPQHVPYSVVELIGSKADLERGL
jgi:hypothetical protein